MEYKLTTEQLAKMVRDFEADQREGFVSNDKLWVEDWIKKNIS